VRMHHEGDAENVVLESAGLKFAGWKMLDHHLLITKWIIYTF